MNLLSEAFSLTILSLTAVILCELFTLSLSSTLSFGAFATFEFTSLEGAPVTNVLHFDEVQVVFLAVKSAG